jgi:hypothetical protein
MFFEKEWKNVSDADIEDLSAKLSSEMGGWIFHSRVDFSTPTPHMKCARNEPEVMRK